MSSNEPSRTLASSEQAEAAPTVNSTLIRIDDGDRQQQQQQQQPLQQQQQRQTSINMEGPGVPERSFLSRFNEARSQLGRHSSFPGTSIQQPRPVLGQHFNGAEAGGGDGQASSGAFASTPHSPNNHSRHVRSWRMNLNDVLSFSSAPSAEALRSLITHSGNFRYTPLSTSESAGTANGDNIHLMLNQEVQPGGAAESSAGYRVISRLSHSNSLREENAAHHQHNSNTTATGAAAGPPFLDAAAGGAATRPNDVAAVRQPNAGGGAGAGTSNRNSGGAVADIDDENNVVSDIFIKVLSHFVRYLPFIAILFIKFIHDHLLGILDLLVLHGTMYQINKSLREQIAKFSQKSYSILLRDLALVGFVVAYRFVLASSTPDPFGLLVAPPAESVTLAVTPTASASPGLQAVVPLTPELISQLTAKPQTTDSASADATASLVGNVTMTVTKTISLGVLLYYVAVNDLILKLLTIMVKILITMMPTKIIRHKPRARMYVLVEYSSQLYRALAPVHQWLIFLFESYSGLEVISGILFSSFYMGAKGFEFVDRGKSLKKALINFVRNMDYERKPTKDELDAAGTVCPICHDSYTTPVVLECSHIFCDDCVSTWFKREQTCPMCRAKVSEDPAWQDGSTTFFYQFC